MSFIDNTNFQLKEQVFLITGATGHLGQAISKGIAQFGGIPILCGKNESKLERLQSEIEENGGCAYILCFDIINEAQRKKALKQITSYSQRLDGIVHCAHGGRPGTMETSLADDFELSNNIHVQVPFFLVQECMELLKKTANNSNSGVSIVNIASMYGMVSPDPRIYGDSGSNNPPYYGAAKAGLIQLTKYMACHLGQYNIRVNSISPGPFPPSCIQEINPDFYTQLCAKNPLGRIGQAWELIGPVVFLLSSASSYVTGTNLVVDGGWTSW